MKRVCGPSPRVLLVLWSVSPQVACQGAPDTTGADTTGDAGESSGSVITGEDTTQGASPFDGEPLPAGEPGEWLWVDFPEARCRDGSPTGIGVRRGTTDKLAIVFEGGGACFNALSCMINLATYGAGDFDGWKDAGGRTGIFAADAPDNPVGAWHVVYIPYCTGDIHAGDRPDAQVPGLDGAQQFVGYRNVERYLERIYPTFKDVQEVVVAGRGFGATFNYARIADTFAGRVTLLEDSGPLMADMVLAPCLQEKVSELWNLPATLPADCPECVPGTPGGSLVNLPVFFGARYPSELHGLISSEEDSIIRSFFGFGANDCAAALPAMSGAEYKAGLYDLRDNYLKNSGTWGSFIQTGDAHTWIGVDAFYTAEVGGVRLVDWIADLLAGAPSHVSP
mgnify:CR=1 FL=1